MMKNKVIKNNLEKDINNSLKLESLQEGELRTRSDFELSRGTMDPWTWLAAAALKHAIRDLHKKNPVIALDALCFWVEAGPFWLQEVMGYELPPEDVLVLVIGAKKYAKGPISL